MHQIKRNAVTKLNTIIDPDGLLCPIEDIELPFAIKRIFYVCNVPMRQIRGNHAHYKTEQLLICLQGKIAVNLFDGHQLNTYTLMPNNAIYIDRMIWDSQIFLTEKDILLVLCSTNYNKLDYIEDIHKFTKLIDERKSK